MYTREKLPKRIERWRIQGRLVTQSPMHIGDGERLKVLERAISAVPKKLKNPKTANPEYATVFTGCDGKSVIPATSLKGALRAWAHEHGLERKLVERVFGAKDFGGRVIFDDAIMLPAPVPYDPTARFWSDARATALTPQVAIHPGRRSAEERLLYYVEYVLPETAFAVSITGQNTSEEERGFLIYVLQTAFESTERPARLGSEVANGWGSVKWSTTEMELLDVPVWLLSSPVKPWREVMKAIPSAEQERWKTAAQAFQSTRTSATSRIQVMLRFQGPMLINDPTRCRDADANGKGAISHAMVRREKDGTPFVPAQSVRGAFRAQARRIWQTLAWGGEMDLNHLYADREIAAREGEQKDLAGFYALLGTTGWRSPVEITDFRLVSQEEKHVQEFVAVDRFTGGAAHNKKFNAHGLTKPEFHGTFTICTDRWNNTRLGVWAWLLLAYVFRDWKEGDGSLGFGAAKGYGAFIADVKVSGNTREPVLLNRILNRDPSALLDEQLSAWEKSLERVVAKTVDNQGVA